MELSDKKVLITGASGFIGFYTVRAFIDAGWTVITANRSANVITGVSENYIIDLSTPESILGLKNFPRTDAIIHLAAAVNFPNAADKLLYVQNSLSTGCVAKLAKDWSAYLFYASTISVHGNDIEYVNINSPVVPDSVYASTKWLGEELIKMADINYGIFRLGGVFGANGPTHLGINSTIINANKGISPILYGKGSSQRNYIYVKDLALAILECTEKQISGINLLAGSDVLTFSNMLSKIKNEFLPEVGVIEQPGGVNLHKVIRPTVEFQGQRSFEEALIDIRHELEV